MAQRGEPQHEPRRQVIRELPFALQRTTTTCTLTPDAKSTVAMAAVLIQAAMMGVCLLCWHAMPAGLLPAHTPCC